MNHKLLLIGTATMFFASTAMAVEDSDDGTGYYISVNADYVKPHVTENLFFKSSSADTTALGGGINVGYIALPNFALEIGFDHLPAVKAKMAGSLPPATLDLSGYLAYFLVRSRVQFQHGITANIHLGMAYVKQLMTYTDQANSKAQLFRPTFGLGLAYAVNPNVSINLEWQRVTGNHNAFDGYAQQQQAKAEEAKTASQDETSTFNRMPNLDLFKVGFTYRF